jgi:hypothetical protein
MSSVLRMRADILSVISSASRPLKMRSALADSRDQWQFGTCPLGAGSASISDGAGVAGLFMIATYVSYATTRRRAFESIFSTSAAGRGGLKR